MSEATPNASSSHNGRSPPLVTLVSPGAKAPAREPLTSPVSPPARQLGHLDQLTLATGFVDLSTAGVVDRRELSMADISHMRLNGCRTHHQRSPGALSLSCLVGPGSSQRLQPSASPVATTPATAAAEALPPPPPGNASAQKGERNSNSSGAPPRPANHARLQRSDSPHGRLETSMRILERMSQDTAVRGQCLNVSPSPMYNGGHSNGSGSSCPPAGGTLGLAGSPRVTTTTYTTCGPGFAETEGSSGGSPGSSGLVRRSETGVYRGADGCVSDARFAVLGRRDTELASLCGTGTTTTPTHPSSRYQTATAVESQLGLVGFARTTMNDDSLDNVASVTTTTVSQSTVEGKDRAVSQGSEQLKPSTSVSVSAGDDAHPMPVILALSLERKNGHTSARSAATAAAQTSAQDVANLPPGRSLGSSVSLERSPRVVSSDGAATTMPPSGRSPRGTSPNRLPPAALSVSELLLGHQIASQRTQANGVPRRTCSVNSNGLHGQGSSGYPWLERGKMFSRDSSTGTGLTTTTNMLDQLHRSNHDLQRILSREDKEALTISIQPYEEIDEDAEVVLLDTTRSKKRCQQASAEAQAGRTTGLTSSTANSSDNRPDEAEAVTDAKSNGSGARLANHCPSPLRRPAKGFVEGDGSGSPTMVQPFQTWRFPLLGKSDSPLHSPQCDPSGDAFHRECPSSGAVGGHAEAASAHHAGSGVPNGHRSGTTATTTSSLRRPSTSEGEEGVDRKLNGFAATMQHRDSWSYSGRLGVPQLSSVTSAHGLPPSHPGAMPSDADASPHANATKSSTVRTTTITSSSGTTGTTATTTTSEAESNKLLGLSVGTHRQAADMTRPHGSRNVSGHHHTATPTTTANSLPVTSQSSVNMTSTATATTGTLANTTSSTSGSNPGTRMLTANAANVDFIRRFEMVYVAYLKGQRAAGAPGELDGLAASTATTATATTILSPFTSPAPTPGAVANARRVSTSVTVPQHYGSGSSGNPPALEPLLQQPRASITTMTSAPQISIHNRQPSLMTPATSLSGALGRSAGYYSFGNRLSLHHPNRQSVPSTPQELQSFGHLPSGLRGYAGASLSIDAPLHARPRAGAAAVAASTAPEAFSSRRRSLDPAIVERIARRPLLQTTVFVYYAQAQLREEHQRCEQERDGTVESAAATTAQRSRNDAPSNSDRRTSTPHSVGRRGEEAAASPSASASASVASAGAGRLQTPLGSPARRSDKSASQLPYSLPVAASRLESNSSANTSALKTPASGTEPRVSSAEDVGSATKLIAEAALDGGHAAATAPPPPPLPPAAPQPQVEAPVLSSELPPTHPQAGEEVSARSPPPPPPCYRRALTPFTTLVRHVHSIDGYEREVDNENGDLVVYIGMRLMGWLEVVSLLGRGSFGQVFLCKDLRVCDGYFVPPSEIEGDDYTYWNCCHAYLPFSDCDIPPTHAPLVAVKVVKSVPLFEQQSVLEAEMLVLIGAQTARGGDAGSAVPNTSFPDRPGSCCDSPGSLAADPPPPDPRCAYVAKVLADGTCFGHHCIVMERYGANIYEYVEHNNHSGLPMYQVRSIGRQLLSALTLLHEECRIIHADIKPENMLLTMDSCRSAMSTNHLLGSAPVSAVPQDQPGQPQQPSTMPSQPQQGSRADREQSTEPPRQHARKEGSGEGVLERSYITLSGGGGGNSGGDATPAAATTKTTVLLDGTPAAAGNASPGRKSSSGQSCRQLPLGGSCQNLTVGGAVTTTVVAPEPQRVHPLNQPRPSGGAAVPSASLPEAGGAMGLSSSVTGRVAAGAALPVPAAPVIPRLHVKLIDFSSSCYDGGPFYSYIQSRYYRAPEVIVQSEYGAPIDMWSTGCVLAELFLGMPLLPGENDHHQLSLIEEMLGALPTPLLERGMATELYYERQASNSGADGGDGAGSTHFRLISSEEYFRRNEMAPVMYTKYFNFKTLQELARHCPLSAEERRMGNGEPPYPPEVMPSSSNATAASAADGTPSAAATAALTATFRNELMKQRFYLFDLLRQLLNPDPSSRPTAAAALVHPFFTMTPTYMRHFALE